MFTNNKNNKGVVLLSVLMVILLLSSIAAFIGNKYFISLKRFAYLEYQTQAINYYRGIESISMKRIKDELEANKEYLPRNHPLLNDIPGLKECTQDSNFHITVAEEFVDASTGSGLVHLSPANGEEDIKIANKRNEIGRAHV